MCDNCDYIITTERAKDKIIAGVDEVARGTFIGPVIAACVVLPKDFPDDTFKQIKDSKKLSENKREDIFSPLFYIIFNAILVFLNFAYLHKLVIF